MIVTLVTGCEKVTVIGLLTPVPGSLWKSPKGSPGAYGTMPTVIVGQLPAPLAGPGAVAVQAVADAASPAVAAAPGAEGAIHGVHADSNGALPKSTVTVNAPERGEADRRRVRPT